MLQLICCWRTYLWCSRLNRADAALYQLDSETEGNFKRKQKTLQTQCSLLSSKLQVWGILFVVEAVFAYERRGEAGRGAQHKSASGAGPLRYGEMDTRQAQRDEGTGLCSVPLSHTTNAPASRWNSPQKGTFITLRDRSWGRGEHLFQSLRHNIMTVSIHQPQSQEPAQLDRTFLCDGVWRDVTSAHTTQPAAPHEHSTRPSSGQANPKESPQRVGRALGGRSGTESLKILAASRCSL